MRTRIAALGGLLLMLSLAYTYWYLPSLACPPMAEIRATLLQNAAAQQCANVSITAEHCVVRLQGRVENATQRARLQEAAASIQGVSTVNAALLRVIGPPFCEILDVLEPLQQQENARNIGLHVQLLNKVGQKVPVYTTGENIIIEVTTPAAFDSFVYVDYYTTDGQVQHLFPNLQEALNHFPPRSVYTVGQPDEQHMVWQPYLPFGRELITVLASRKPLVFQPKAPRYDPEPYNLYLDQLRQALPQELTDIGAAIYTIETRANP